ncbi:Phosphoadenosine phosphosulfate reductase thioredoxin [Hysterangium stoloniferum]|nr:Phosphoadenosine phosphosulfate reductase thioredoxin [Hysterangium stoloniferum]
MPVRVPSPSLPCPLQFPLTQLDLDRINGQLSALSPQGILEWGISNLPKLYQTTAFGLTGLVTIDMLSQLTSTPPPLIFFDTLYHFPETLELIEDVKKRYGSTVHIFKPDGADTVEAFESRHGEKLWEVSDSVYDYLVKVEPARRAYATLDVQSVITGRRASQGGERAALRPLEVDSTGLLKLNPLFSWTFGQVKGYIDAYNVPQNKLIDKGYKSIGDWHSTVPSGEGDTGERAGRWRGKNKTECGLHKDYFVMKRLIEKKREVELRIQDEDRGTESFEPVA